MAAFKSWWQRSQDEFRLPTENSGMQQKRCSDSEQTGVNHLIRADRGKGLTGCSPVYLGILCEVHERTQIGIVF